jgi:hypothetical protein
MLVEGLAREHFDALLGAVAGGDVDAGVSVGDRGFGCAGSGGGLCERRPRVRVRRARLVRGWVVCKGMARRGLALDGRGRRIGRLFGH